MSKMPAKKKSCFQITSVTTAQATSSITEDTESLDDPDESRTEDVSSEIFDVSRATDYGPEDVVERSSSEETLNNVGEAETPGTMSPNVPHESFGIAGTVIGVGGGAVTRSSGQVATGGPSGQLSAPHTPTALPGVATPTSAPHVTSQPAASSTATCSSRFRVIKLDHGSGEPYRRGRWTCMEYYDRDSDSTLISRTGDTIRHTSTIDHSVDRDSGLGATGGSVVASAVHIGYAPESLADSPLTAVSQLPSSEKMNQPSQQQHFVIGQQPIGGAVSQGAAQPMYPGAAVTTQQMMVQQSQSHVSPQNIVQGGHNGKGTVPQNVPVTITQQQASVSTQSLTGQIDDRRKSEPLPQPSVSLISEKSFVKVPITDALANPLHLPVFGLPIPVDGDDDRNPSSAFYEAFHLKVRGPKKLCDSASSANVVAIDNKIEQAMDLVKSHLMYAVREEVEVLKEQIKELIEKNSTLERENALLKSLSNNDQLSQLSTQVGLNSCQQQPPVTTAPLTAPQIAHPTQQPNVSSA
ncbi:TSC22 domain family protein 2 isoform X3 [Spea bombifrons]|uniref:TSC22 domain family protein 2 isoform X3 n=1 Tax=Spea bombifrons TaxID=233779 RepID=UPI00234B5617|nr:TSC22 domain family protein 2 isoform X3 [Spea bombifrons]